MSQLPLADATPLRVTGTLFKGLVFAFEPQDIPDGARTLRTLRGNGATIADEVDDAAIILVDPEHPGALELLQEAASKVILHHSWVNKSLNVGHPLVESSNWGDCRVTPDNINNNFIYVPPPPPSNPQLQTPRPTPENRSFNFSMPSGFSQGSGGITPPSSQLPYTPTPSHWNRDPVMVQQTPQLPLTNQVAPYNSQLMQSSTMFSSFPVSQSADMGAAVYGQQSTWPPLHPGAFGMIQPPTLEDLRRAYEVMMWFQRPSMYQQLPAPPTPTQPNPTFHPPPPPPTQRPPDTTGSQLEAPTVPGTPVAGTLSHQDSIGSSDTLPDLGDPLGCPPLEGSTLPISPAESVQIPPPLPSDNPMGPPTMPVPLHTYPKLFEHDIGKPIMFCVPIILKGRGRIAEIFRATGGGFTDDVEDADYIVLGQWEEHYFDEMWYSAQDYTKPTVTPAFVIDSYEKGKLMDPNDYPTRGPEKPRRDEPKRVRSRPVTSRKRRGRGRGGSTAASPRATPPTGPSEESPKWLRFFKEAEHTKSLQYIGAMFKKNAELTHDALAIHLHNKMPNHTINSWKKYCLHRKDAIEDLRKRAVGNAEKRTTPKDKDLADVTGTGASATALPTPQQTTSRQVTPQQATPQQVIPQQAISQQAISQQAIPQQTDHQQAIPQATPQQATDPHESQQPPPPYEKVAEPESVVVKTEPLDEDQMDFAFATQVLSGWNANEESDVALWKRMESMQPSATAPSWEAFCERHWSRFEHFFANKSTKARG